MSTLWQDIRYGFRMLAKNPGFTTVVVVILALGIGTTTAMLSVVDAVLLRPPPGEAPDSLVRLCKGKADDLYDYGTTSYPNVVDWRDQSTVFEDVGGIMNASFWATTETRRRRVFALGVSPAYLSLLRVKPVLGRTFLAEEAEPDREPVVLISRRFWQAWFGGTPDVVGRPLVLDRKSYTVIGVLSDSFRSGGNLDVWLPLAPLLQEWYEGGFDREGGYMYAIARLKPGVTMV